MGCGPVGRSNKLKKVILFLKRKEELESCSDILIRIIFSQILRSVIAFFSNQGLPARSCVEVGRLAKGAKVEIEAIGLARKP